MKIAKHWLLQNTAHHFTTQLLGYMQKPTVIQQLRSIITIGLLFWLKKLIKNASLKCT